MLTAQQISRLNKLKKMLLNAPDTGAALSAVLSFFLDQVATSEFIAASEDFTSPDMDKVLRDFSALPEIFGETVRKRNTPLKRVEFEESAFVHGDFTMRQHLGVMIYFEEVRKGLVSLRFEGDEIRMRTFTQPAVVSIDGSEIG